ncbi:hypothetical protein GCM10022263_37410 [Nocardioides daeguensis]|uniref:Solute-binding protein family 3/N-terminal domain-containing protein n=2 Tax=Nocardioides daeguensis TaxID=908359 RepID=A0ABP6W671_9ACTN
MIIRTTALVAAASALALAIQGCSDTAADSDRTEIVAKIQDSDLPDSERIDAIKERGELRVGVLPGFPFLVQDITGDPNDYAGPAWYLANAYADALGVKLKVVPVTHETKIPVLAADQVDITISPLSVTDERKEVVDFVEYTDTGVCYIGLKDNEKFTSIDDFSDLNSADMTLAYFQGQPTEELLVEKYPELVYRAVPGSGGDVPIEEILSGRADVAVVSPQATGPQLTKAYPDLATFPEGDDCLDSEEFALPNGMAIDKGQPEFLDVLQEVFESVADEVADEERRVVDEGIGFSISGG